MVGFELEVMIRFTSARTHFIIVVSTVPIFVTNAGKRRNESAYGGSHQGYYYSVFRTSRNSIWLACEERSTTIEAFRYRSTRLVRDARARAARTRWALISGTDKTSSATGSVLNRSWFNATESCRRLTCSPLY